MKAVFIETTEFTEWVSEHLSDEVYSGLQQEIMDNPQKGAVMRGCGGLRKVRAADPRRGKGKRSGVRLIYLYVPTTKWFFMLDVYDKDDKEDLSSGERRLLAKLANDLKSEAKAAVSRREGRQT